MKRNLILTAALLAFSAASHATYCSLENPQFCPPATGGNPSVTASPTSASTSGSTSNAGARSTAGATSGSTSGANANQTSRNVVTSSPTLNGGNTSVVASPTASGGGASLVSDNDTRNLSLGFPPPSQAAPLPAIRCRSTSMAGSLGWSFISGAKSDTDTDGLCQAADVAAMLLSNCQQRSAYEILYPALNAAHKASLVVPSDAVNAPGGVCPRPATMLAPVAVPTPTPAPAARKTVERITLKAGALFDTAQSTIKPSAQAQLDELAGKLRAARLDSVAVIGHTDAIGTDAYNDDLSLRRAAAMRAALALRGVSPAVIAIDGRGKREPVADNRMASGREQNRRVTVDIFGQAE